MESLQTWLSETAGDPWLQSALLFAGTFVLEEAALLTAALLAAAGELRTTVALAAVFLGIVVSDWCLYYLGYLAGRIGWFRAKVGERTLEKGRKYLGGRLTMALVAARLIPWLLFPIFVCCGFLGVGFRRFAFINLAIAALYTLVLFFAVMFLGQVVFDYLENWGWLLFAPVIIAIALLHRRLARKAG